MNFELNEDQRAFRDVAAQFTEEFFVPNAAEWDEKNIFPRDELLKAAELGFGGIYVGEEVGGSALTRLDAALVFEELSKGCPSTAAFISIHNMAAWMIDSFGDGALSQRLLPDVCAKKKNAS